MKPFDLIFVTFLSLGSLANLLNGFMSDSPLQIGVGLMLMVVSKAYWDVCVTEMQVELLLSLENRATGRFCAE